MNLPQQTSLKIAAFLVSTLFLDIGFSGSGRADTAHPGTTLRIAVVGDTGIGERAYGPGYRAVMDGIEREKPGVLLHLGDFVYQGEKNPPSCTDEFIREIRQRIAEPYPVKLFVPGDNDLPPSEDKPMASGCWENIADMGTPFDPPPESGVHPGQYEGVKVVGNVFFAILDNSKRWRDPTAWLQPAIEQARKNGLWVVVAIHEPPVTTAWYLDKRDTELKALETLRPDLVFSGNQHSYERFHPDFKPADTSKYAKGSGTLYIVSGGGGATFKPFADLQGLKDRSAPQNVLSSIAKRALMNHYLILEVSPTAIRGKTYRVCTAKDEKDGPNPRWKPEKKFWSSIPLSCDGLPAGTDLFDEFEIVVGGREK